MRKIINGVDRAQEGAPRTYECLMHIMSFTDKKHITKPDYEIGLYR